MASDGEPDSAAFFRRLIITCSSWTTSKLASRCQSPFDPEAVGCGNPVDEGRPGDGRGPGLRQLGKLRIALDERGEVGCALADGGEHLFEPRALGPGREEAPRAGERADRREGVVELVRDDADDLLPHDHFLGGELTRELLEEDELVRLAVEHEAAPGEMVNLRLAAD